MLSIWLKEEQEEEGEEQEEEEEEEEEENMFLSIPTALQLQCTLPMVSTWSRS
jgi:hypothetical protein